MKEKYRMGQWPGKGVDMLALIGHGYGMDAALATSGEPVDREDLFIECLTQYPTKWQAGVAAGYSESYSKGPLSTKFKNKRFMDKLRAHYNGNAAFLLPKILNAESAVVQLVTDDPMLLPKFRHTLKELKQSAGVLQPDAEAGQPAIQITNIRSMVLQMQEEPAIIQEAEVVPITE